MVARRLEPVLDGAPVQVSLKDPRGRYVYVNAAWLAYASKNQLEVLERTDDELFPPEGARLSTQGDQRCLETGAVVEFEQTAQAGASPSVLRCLKYPVRDKDGQISGVATIALDITASHETQRKLEASEKRYRELLEHSPEAFFVLDVSSAQFVDTNENTESLFRMTRAELLASSPAGLSPPLQPDGTPSEVAATGYIQRALAGETPVFDWLHQAKDGELLPCRIWLARVDLESGPGVRASLLDMREIERMRSTLERTRAQLDAVQHALPQVVVVYEPEIDRMVLCNRTYQRLSPRTPLWITAQNACDQARAAGHAKAELSVQAADGQTKLMSVEVSIFQGAASEEPLQLLLVGTDVTEQKEMDSRLQNARSLESLGRLAGGVAHDFNNLLTVILGSAEFLGSELQGNRLAEEDLAALKDAAKQAKDLTAQLLSFARSNQGREEPLLLDHHLASCMTVLQRLVGEDIETIVQLGAPRQRVLIDPGQLEQVLVNLLANGREAMTGGGKIMIATQQVEGSGQLDLPTGRFVELSVTDAGQGMAAATVERAFDPFFTTKTARRGAGLGLSTVYGIVERAGGKVRIDSELGVGTKVRVFLPACGADPVEGHPSLPRPTEKLKFEILLVEDDDGVRGVNSRALSRAGHTVTTAASGDEALRLMRGGRRFDVVVTDVVMPKLSGFELAEQVRRDFATLPFVFVSGYAEEALRQRGLGHGDVDILQKPFAPDLLIAKVAEALAPKARAGNP